MKTKKCVLIITDGIGIDDGIEANAFKLATKPTYDKLFETYPHSRIKTYGQYVGLPHGQMGNSEVGHMTMGAGRVLYQDLVKIGKAIANDSLITNKIVCETTKDTSTVHLIGLLSDGGVHSHIDHTIYLATNLVKQGKNIWLHLITDGRDVAPQSCLAYIKQIQDIDDKNINIATIGGRYFAMDRDSRYDRVQKGYDAIVSAKPKTSKNINEYIKSCYDKDIHDEFIPPVAFDGFSGIKNGDCVIFTNFRSDRMRQFVGAMSDKSFDKFPTKDPKINIATMTKYDDSFNSPIIFDKQPPQNILSEIISRYNLRQLHTAETEKYAHVTFFFNGGIEKPYQGESRVLINSPKVDSYDEKPQMSAHEVASAVIDGIADNIDFIIVNFANGDMVGHTGNLKAGIKAVEVVDECLGQIITKATEQNYSLVITSDHGNCEKMRDDHGNILTNHTVGDVFCFVIDKDIKAIKDGSLNHIAPTVLKLMGIDIPPQMDEPLV